MGKLLTSKKPEEKEARDALRVWRDARGYVAIDGEGRVIRFHVQPRGRLPVIAVVAETEFGVGLVLEIGLNRTTPYEPSEFRDKSGHRKRTAQRTRVREISAKELTVAYPLIEGILEYLVAHQRSNWRHPEEWWGRRAKTLWHTWKGDPFRMYESGTIDSVMAWKGAQKDDPIPGIGPKIASLIAIFFEEIGMDAVPDAFPVDVHVQRFALALGLVSLKRIDPILNETLEQILRPALSELCREEGWSRIALSHAIWFRGNRGCTNCSRTLHAELSCPVYVDCGGVLASKSYFRMGLWLPEAGPLPKGGSAKFISFEDKPLFLGTGA